MNTTHSLAAFAGLLGLLPALAIAQPKVDEFPLGPYDPRGTPLAFSTDGLHVALQVPKGSKSVIMVDGVEGPRFDMLINQVVFSADGTRHAYTAVSGTDGILVLDGKEVAREPLLDNIPSYMNLVFSPGGKRFAYIRRERETKGAFNWLVVDGTQGERVTGIQNLVFSPDETRFAYLGGHQSDKTGMMLFVDGKNVGRQGVDPQFSPDGKTVVTVGHTPTESVLLMNGKAGSRAKSIRGVYMSKAGINLLVLGTQAGNAANGEFLGVGGKKIEGSECERIEWVKFSPDGKRYAALCSAGTMIKYLLIDGKKGENYPGITEFEFSPDSSRYTYMARGAHGSFRVVDGEESQGYNTYQRFSWGGGGKRFGYIGYGNMIKEGDVVIDGKAAKYPGPRLVSFSADGSRSAFVGGDPFFGTLYLDGVEQKGVGVIAPANTNAEHVILSPDGKSHAHYGFVGGNRDKRGLVANGRLLAEFAQLYTAPLFTPDSQHVFCLVSNPGSGKSHALLLNGKRVLTLDAMTSKSASVPQSADPFGMGADGVFTLIGVTDGQYKRFRVTASASHTLAHAIADVDAAAAKAVADAEAKKKADEEAIIAKKKKAEEDKAAADAKAKADAEARAKSVADAAAKRKADAEKAAADRAAKARKK